MSAQTDHIETHCGPIFQYSPAEDHIDHGTVRERMCLCMYATDPRKPRLERDIRFGSFFCLGPLCPAPAMVRGQFGFLLCLRSLLALSFSGRQATGTPTPFPSLRLRREFLSLSVGCRSCARLWLFSGATPAAGLLWPLPFSHVSFACPCPQVAGLLLHLRRRAAGSASDRRLRL